MNLHATGSPEFDRQHAGGPLDPTLWITPPQNQRTEFRLTWSESGELFIVASVSVPVEAGRAAADIYGRIAETVRKHGLAIVHERVFGSLIAERTVMAERNRALLAQEIPPGAPVTYVGDGTLYLPASTGIRGEVHSGVVATMDLFAIIGEPAFHPKVTQLTNRSQLDAFRYGAAFSRGTLIKGSAGSLFQLSGTAAIDERGKSLFIGDIRGQITCTLNKVEALMAQVGAGLRDICAATVFVKRPEYVTIFHEITAERRLADLPAVYVVADICRDELLFEIDAEAVITP